MSNLNGTLLAYSSFERLIKLIAYRLKFSILLSIISGVLAGLLVAVINQGIHATTRHATLAILFFALAAGAMATRYWSNAIIINESQDFKFEITQKLLLFISCLELPLYESLKSEDIKLILIRDIDTATLAFPDLVNLFAASITIICCIIYLIWFSVLTFLILCLLGVALIILYMFVERIAIKGFLKARELDVKTTRVATDFLSGFKQIKLDKTKMHALLQEHHLRNEAPLALRKRSLKMFKLNESFGELLYLMVIGSTIYGLGNFLNFSAIQLTQIVVILLYLIGPILNLLLASQNIVTNLKVTLHRIAALVGKLSTLEVTHANPISTQQVQNFARISLEKISYQYFSENGQSFQLGPISLHIYPGQLIFITGGNGSGKSTLLKVIAGLYLPEAGNITWNNCYVDSTSIHQYRELFSPVFADHQIFDGLYGYKSELDQFKKLLNQMHISHHVSLDNAGYMTTEVDELSSGQKKRLALSMTLIEKRPILLFDEWAAEQDPDFRAYFYKSLLPQFKSQGLTVIAITHDDQYFSVADKIIKLSEGKVLYDDVLVGQY